MVVNQGNTSVYSEVTEFTGSSTEFRFANLKLKNEPFTVYFTDTYGSDTPTVMHGMRVLANAEFGMSIITDTEIEEPATCLLLEITYESDEIVDPVDIRRHVFDTVIHITQEERDKWNKKIAPEDLVSGDINEIKINNFDINGTDPTATVITSNKLLIEAPETAIKGVLFSKKTPDALYQGEDNKQGITLGSYGTPLYLKGTPVSLSYLVNGVEQDSRIMTKADLNVAVANAVTDVSRYRYEVRTTVPDPADANTNTIYLVPSVTHPGYYDQYVKVQQETTPGVYDDIMKNVGLISAIQGEKGEKGEDGYTLVAVSDFTENDGEQNVIALCPQQYTLNAGKVVYGISFELGNDVSAVVDNDPLYVIISDENGNPFAISTDTFDPTFANTIAKVRFANGFLIPENGKFIISFSPSPILPNSVAQMPQRTICVRTRQNPSAENNAYIITEGSLSDPDVPRTQLNHGFAITYYFIYDKELSNLSVILNQTIPQLRRDIETNRINIDSADVKLENHINDATKHLNETTIGNIMRRMVDTEYKPNSENAVSSKALAKVIGQLGPMKIEQLYPHTSEFTDNTLYYYKETGAGDDSVTPTELTLDDTMTITSTVGDDVVTRVNLTIETEGTDHFTVNWPKNIIWNKKPESPLLNYTTYDVSIKKIKTPTGETRILADSTDYYDRTSVIELPAGKYILADVRHPADTTSNDTTVDRRWQWVKEIGNDNQPTRINLTSSFLNNKVIFKRRYRRKRTNRKRIQRNINRTTETLTELPTVVICSETVQN